MQVARLTRQGFGRSATKSPKKKVNQQFEGGSEEDDGFFEEKKDVDGLPVAESDNSKDTTSLNKMTTE